MSENEFKVEVQEVPRPAGRARPSLRDLRPNPLVDRAVSRIVDGPPEIPVAAFQSSI
jgi:hypothetical protein